MTWLKQQRMFLGLHNRNLHRQMLASGKVRSSSPNKNSRTRVSLCLSFILRHHTGPAFHPHPLSTCGRKWLPQLQAQISLYLPEEEQASFLVASLEEEEACLSQRPQRLLCLHGFEWVTGLSGIGGGCK